MESLQLHHFKKIHEDAHKAVLEHPNGHQITIAKPALSKKMKNQIEAIPMASGGEVPLEEETVNREPSSFDANPVYQTQADPTQLQSINPSEQAPQVAPNQEEPGFLSKVGKFLTSDFHTPEAPSALDKYAPNPKSAKELIEEGRSGAGKVSASQEIKPQLQAAPENYHLGTGFQNVANTAGSMNPLFAANEASSQAYLGGLGQRIAGANQAAQLTGQQGLEQSSELNNQINHAQEFANNAQAHFESMNNELSALAHDAANNHINPNQYLDSMSTGGKISTALGMLLSGLGGSQQNSVIDFLNKQIDRNIDSQKADMGNKHNLMTALLHQQGNMTNATSMMQAFYKNMYADKISQMVAKYAGPQAQAQAQQLAGQWKQEASQIIGTAAQTKALEQMNTSGKPGQQMDSSLLVRALVPKERQEDAYRELKTQENINAINKNAMNAFDKVSGLQTIGSRVSSPFQSKSQINAYWDPMIDKITKQNEGRVTPITVEMINSLKPSIQDNQESLNIKRQGLYALLNGERSTPVLDSFRIPINKNIGLAQKNSQVGAGYAHAGSGKKGSVASK